VIGAGLRLDLAGFRALPEATVRKAVRIAVSGAAAPVKARAAANAQAVARTGAMAKSLRIKVKLYPSLKFVAVVGPSMKFQRGRKRITRGPLKGQVRKDRPWRYVVPLERGTRRSTARPFLGPAHAAGWPQFQALVVARVRAELLAALAARAAGTGYRTRRG
jgi:hypothetical protein